MISEEDGKDGQNNLYHKKKRTEKFVRSETNHRVMTKAELAQWEKEAELKDGEKQRKLPVIDLNVRTALLREKENVEFILNNETFELAEEEISPLPKVKSAGVPRSPLRLDLDISVINPGNNLLSVSTIGSTSIIDPLTPSTADISLIVPSGSIRSRSSRASAVSANTSTQPQPTKRLAISRTAEPLTPCATGEGGAPAKRYARRSKRPTLQLTES